MDHFAVRWEKCIYVASGAVCVIALGCSAPAEDDGGIENSGEFGQAVLELTTTPTGVACIKVTATPTSGTAVSKTFAVTSGSATDNLVLGQLTLSNTTFQGYAYNLACTDPNFATAMPNWVSDPVTIQLRAGAIANVPLTFRPDNSVSASANFVGNIVRIDAGTTSTWVILSDGSVRVTGWSTYVPTSAPSFTSVAEMAVAGHYCVRHLDGTVACAGNNSDGQVGVGVTGGSYSTLQTIPSLQNALQLAIGEKHTCARGTGYYTCWGDNSFGQIGNNTTNDVTAPLTGWAGVDFVVAGSNHTCTINYGTVQCNGSNVYGQLGDGTTTQRNSPVPVSGINGAIALAAGNSHTCALLANNTVKCWGNNSNGQLGNGTFTQSSTPVAVSGLSDAVEIVASDYTTCARRSTGSVSCWGKGYYGTVGDGTGLDRNTPTAVTGLTSVSMLNAAGIGHVCALRTDSTIYCWGANNVGQLGNNTTTEAFTPVLMQMQ